MRIRLLATLINNRENNEVYKMSKINGWDFVICANRKTREANEGTAHGEVSRKEMKSHFKVSTLIVHTVHCQFYSLLHPFSLSATQKASMPSQRQDDN